VSRRIGGEALWRDIGSDPSLTYRCLAGTTLQLSSLPHHTLPSICQPNSFTYTSTLFDILTTPTVGPLRRPRHVERLNPSPDSICSRTRRLRLAPRYNGRCEQRGKRRLRQSFYNPAEEGVEAQSGVSVPTNSSASLYLQGIYHPSRFDGAMDGQ